MNNAYNRIAAVLAIIFSPLYATAQTIVNREIELKLQTASISATVKDKETSEPVDFASAYLVKQNDSTMCCFGLTNQGKITFDKLVKGQYTIYVEMMGYTPYARRFSIPTNTRDVYDLGTILLTPSKETLNAAKVVDAADAVKFKKDTVIFNAAAYKVGADSRLGALLSQMPGIEIGENGISFNGEPITKLTIGGRTFFMNDPRMAVATIPAKIVQNIKVFDDDETSGGVFTKKAKKKAMDVTLKKEYRKGTFGDITIAAGAEKDVAVNAQAFAASYNEKNMLTGVGALNMVNDPFNGTSVVYSSGPDLKMPDSERKGKSQGATSGININNKNKKNLETNCFIVYDYNKKDISDTTVRRTLSRDGFYERNERYLGSFESNGIYSKVSTRKMEPGKYLFMANARLEYEKINDGSISISSEKSTALSAKDNTLNGNIFAFVYLFNVGGKAGREIRMNTSVGFNRNEGEGVYDTYLYNSKRFFSNFLVHGFYDEPLTNRLHLLMELTGSLDKDAIKRDSDFSAYNDNTDTRNTLFNEQIALQLTPNSKRERFLCAGIDASQYKNDNKWQTNVSPTVTYQSNWGNGSISISYSNSVSNPDRVSLMPILNMNYSNVAFIGNPNLKCWINHNYSATMDAHDKNGRFINISVGGYIIMDPILNTTWYDSEGMRFVLPENSDRNSYSNAASLTLYSPIGKAKKFDATLQLGCSNNVNEGKIARGVIDDIQTADFDYGYFKEWLTGTDAFIPSRQTTSSLYINPRLRWNVEKLSLTAEYNIKLSRNRWKENASINEDIVKNKITFSGLYKTDNQWEYEIQYKCKFINGELYDIAKDEHDLSVRIGKCFNKVNVSLRAINLLDCKNSYDVYASPSVQESSMSTRFGRTILATVSFSIGKSSPMQNKRAKDAVKNIIMH